MSCLIRQTKQTLLLLLGECISSAPPCRAGVSATLSAGWGFGVMRGRSPIPACGGGGGLYHAERLRFQNPERGGSICGRVRAQWPYLLDAGPAGAEAEEGVNLGFSILDFGLRSSAPRWGAGSRRKVYRVYRSAAALSFVLFHASAASETPTSYLVLGRVAKSGAGGGAGKILIRAILNPKNPANLWCTCVMAYFWLAKGRG